MATAGERSLQPALLEREAEVATIQSLVAAARGGAGRLLVVEGRAGMGKTRLVGVARAAAQAAGTEVLAARAGELEQEFAFGVVRQLFEPLLARASAAERDELTAGAAVLALPLFQEPHLTAGQGATGTSFAMLHGLYWLAANLALRRPALLTVDDLHWADAPSLRWITYLARRLEGLPLLLVVAARPPEQSPQVALLTEVVTDPAAAVVRPGPLGTDAVAVLVRGALSAEPDPAFVTACQTASGGNPLFVRALLDTLARERLVPSAANAARVLQTGPEAVARAVSLRLARLPAEAAALVRAAAVLGDGAPLQHAAALAALEVGAAARAASVLVRDDLLRVEDPVEFTHPVVRTVIHQQLDAGERTRAHRRAGELLVQAGAPPEQAAAHLLLTPPTGDALARRTLRRAAERSLAQGAPAAAATYLRRALEEPSDEQERGELLSMLGNAELQTGAHGAIEHLGAAYALIDDAARRAQTALPYALGLVFVGHLDRAVDVLGEAIERLGDRQPELGEHLEAVLITFAVHEPEPNRVALERLAAVPEATLHPGPGGNVMRAVMAFHEARVGASRARSVALALRAFQDGLLVRSSDVLFGLQALFALTVAGEVDTASRVFEEALGEARRRGDLLSVHTVLLYRGLLAAQQGDLLRAEEDLRSAELDPAEQAALALYRAGYLADVLLDRDQLEDAARALELADAGQQVHSGHRLPHLYGRARVNLEAGRLEQAVLDLFTLGDHARALGIHNPAFYPWRSQAARALHRLGRGAEALELARAEAEAARQWGAPRTVGISLRVLGLVQGGPAGEALLREAVAVLEGSQARVELARALVELGAALRRGNRRGEARAPLRRGLELAYRTGAPALVRQAQDELAVTGARSRKLVLTGVDALTPSERRVARMAAQGMSNKELAQALFVTVKAVEVHLSSVYRKLQISSRGQLAEALAGSHDAPGASIAP
jgi:DNA-binding CsgD family transcriptional regulator